MAWGCCGGAPPDADYINTLRSELANSYYWSGSCIKDYIFFVCQWHPLIGIFLSHPNHPWTKRERVLMFLCSLALTLVPSAMIAAFLHDKGVRHVLKVLLTLILVTLPDTIFGVVLYQLSVADTKCPLCAACTKSLEGCLMTVILIVGALSTILSSTILGAVGANWFDLLQPLIMGKLYSYATWFPIFLLLPCIGFALVWRGERNALMTSDGGSDEQNLLIA